jgi:hypothetical protein
MKKPRLRFRAEAFQKGAGNGARDNQTMLLWLKKAQGSAGLVAGLIGHPEGRRAGQESRPRPLCTLRR